MCLWLIQRTGVRIPEPMWDGLHKDLFLLMSMCGVTMSVCLCVSEHGSLELELHVVVCCLTWGLGTEHQSSGKSSALHCWAVSPALTVFTWTYFTRCLLLLLLFVHMYVCLCVMMCTCRGRRSLGSQFSLFAVGPRDWTQVIRLGMMSAFTYWVPRQLLYLFFLNKDFKPFWSLCDFNSYLNSFKFIFI